MKFAKTLEDRMVPEWRTKYINYKQGKKRIKAATTNLRNAGASPAISALKRSVTRPSPAPGQENEPRPGFSPCKKTGSKKPKASPAPSRTFERSPLSHARAGRTPTNASLNYGAMGVSPPAGHTPSRRRENESRGPPSLLLPDPMQPLDEPRNDELLRAPTQTSRVESGSEHISKTPSGGGGSTGSRPFIHRVLSTFTGPRATIITPSGELDISSMQAEAAQDFMQWLLTELAKCETFYAHREAEVVKRFEEMREQLDLMRKTWLIERGHTLEEDDSPDLSDNDSSPDQERTNGEATEQDMQIRKKKRAAWKNFAEAMNGLTHPEPTISDVNDISTNIPRKSDAISQDYERRRPKREPVNVPTYRVAKRKLKKAYIEYYHGLEMLKSYVTVNREGFRKITKKFDKASGMRMSHRFMTEYVDKSYFGGATNKLDDLLNDTELLFARFFEKGNRKEASLRLRSRENRTAYYDSVWRSGFALGAALVLGIYGLYMGIKKENDKSDMVRSMRTGYALQIWGGAALIHLQALLFAINLRFWTKNKINYAFIFEFDTRTTLAYWQFSEIPAIFSLIFSVCFWFSMYDFWPNGLDMIYWPVVYIGIILVLLLNPFQIFYYPSRKWFLQTMWRLFFSGLYPVEFKDFWTGDILCSQTYAMGNIELFFCLYAHSWNNPSQCNSSHSRLLGFFQTLPGIWRLLQCFKRYHSSRKWFPHLVNGLKYTFTILYYMTLSIWRVDKASTGAKAAFIVCAAINATYCTVWDLAMDWSLLNPYSKHPLLRDSLGFKKAWPYYTAMVIDPIIRFEWIFYVIFANDLQHSAVLSFALSLAEVLRRFVWCFFRMENEHVGNVGAHRAYRDLPLPYSFATESKEGQPLHPIAESEPHAEGVGRQGQRGQQAPDDRQFSCGGGAEGITTGAEVDLERMETIRQRLGMVRTMTRVGKTLQDAHLQDYERKRLRDGEAAVTGGDGESESSSEETDEEEALERIEMEKLRARKRRQSQAREERNGGGEMRRGRSGGSVGRRSSDS